MRGETSINLFRTDYIEKFKYVCKRIFIHSFFKTIIYLKNACDCYIIPLSKKI